MRKLTEAKNPENAIKVYQYNILADVYTDMKHSGHFPNRANMAFSHRYPLIAGEIRACQADIMCLCEVDHFDTHYGKLLDQLGYKH